MHQTVPSSDDSQLDFASLLEESFKEIDNVQHGDIVMGTILAIDSQGIIVDVGLKRDGVIPPSELEALDGDRNYQVGQEIAVMVVRPEDRDGNLVVSIRQARALKDWEAALAQMESGKLYTGEVVAANKGGLIVPYGDLRGFVPASHIPNVPRNLDDDARVQHLSGFVGQSLTVKIIEVNPQRRRLVLSQREAQRMAREQAKTELLESLNEGDIVRGRVSSLRDFGAFIDLGGADGLVHVSEMAWRRIRHPNELLQVGMEVEVYVLQLDHEGNRIGLSLKRLHPNPWVEVEENCQVGQLVEGTITRVVSFGAFVELDNGIEALLHLSEMDDPPPHVPEEVVTPGERIVAKVINLEPQRQRMGLSLKELTDEERNVVSVATPDASSPTSSDETLVDEAVAEAGTV